MVRGIRLEVGLFCGMHYEVLYTITVFVLVIGYEHIDIQRVMLRALKEYKCSL